MRGYDLHVPSLPRKNVTPYSDTGQESKGWRTDIGSAVDAISLQCLAYLQAQRGTLADCKITSVWEFRLNSESETTYEVALSFAGEQRTYVEEVARALHSRGIAVFYDEFEKVSLWGKHLHEELQSVYECRSAMSVVFVSKEWVEKAWPRHERRVILSRAIQSPDEYVLPVRFDDTIVPGLPNSVSYLRADEHSPAELASMIGEKLGISPFEGKASDLPPPRMTSLAGEVVFDYSNHNGRYIIGRGNLEFETDWSKASDVSIYALNDPPSIYGIALGPREWNDISQVVSSASLDYTSRFRTPHVGHIVVFRNRHGFYAAVRILGIKDDTRDMTTMSYDSSI